MLRSSVKRLGKSSVKHLAHFFANHRRNKLLSQIDSLFVELHKGYENRNYDFFSNGEYFVLKALRDCSTIETIFDVGANTGEWSKMSSSTFPQAAIHSFEIVPDTYQKLTEACRDHQNVNIHNVGLSNENSETEVYYSTKRSGLATCVSGFSEAFHGYQPEVAKATLLTGDEFCAQQKIEAIDYLKIDVEGYESKVLKGFEESLRAGNIKVIQFEYGYVNIHERFLLKDFYDYLDKFNMKIGKIYPNYVDFKDYDFSDENFYGPNYLAVNAALETVINALA